MVKSTKAEKDLSFQSGPFRKSLEDICAIHSSHKSTPLQTRFLTESREHFVAVNHPTSSSHYSPC